MGEGRTCARCGASIGSDAPEGGLCPKCLLRAGLDENRPTATHGRARPFEPPEPADLSPLDGPGGWHTKGWVGAVLSASQMDLTRDAAGQGEQVGAHLRAGLAAARALRGARGS